jgi:hypothetical protein
VLFRVLPWPVSCNCPCRGIGPAAVSTRSGRGYTSKLTVPVTGHESLPGCNHRSVAGLGRRPACRYYPAGAGSPGSAALVGLVSGLLTATGLFPEWPSLREISDGLHRLLTGTRHMQIFPNIFLFDADRWHPKPLPQTVAE